MSPTATNGGGQITPAASNPGSNGGIAPGRKVKFVAVDTSRGGLPVKRKQVQHACATCRRKKVQQTATLASGLDPG